MGLRSQDGPPRSFPTRGGVAWVLNPPFPRDKMRLSAWYLQRKAGNMIEKEPPFALMLRAVNAHDEGAARALHSRFPDLLPQKGHRLLAHAAISDNVKGVALLVELGVDVNSSAMPPGPEGIIANAACEGAVNAVRWLLEHGAKINHEYDGEVYCYSLLHAVEGGHFEVVKLLVEHGAAVNGGSDEENALLFATGNEEMTEYLLSKGAKEGGQIDSEEPQVELIRS